MTEDLIEICGFKIQAHRKATQTQQDYECRYECNGHKVSCKDYVGVKKQGKYIVADGETKMKGDREED